MCNNQWQIPLTSVLTPDDTVEILENICNHIDLYISNNIVLFYEEAFHVNLTDYLFIQINNQYENIYTDELEYELECCIQKACHIYFSTTIPRRSFKSTFVKEQTNKDKITKQIQFLKNIPQPEQRTDDWYKFRYNLITASSAWKIFSSKGQTNNLIYEKCIPLELGKYSSNNMTGPLHWGQKYEPLSVLFYEDKYKTKIEDFGCIKDPNYNFLGASPDGI